MFTPITHANSELPTTLHLYLNAEAALHYSLLPFLFWSMTLTTTLQISSPLSNTWINNPSLTPTSLIATQLFIKPSYSMVVHQLCVHSCCSHGMALISGDFAPRACSRNVIYWNRMKFLDVTERERRIEGCHS